MFKLITRSLALLFAALLTASMSTDSFNKTVYATNSPADPNPLLAEWAGPYGGVPPFDKVQVALFKPALESAMAENLADIDKVAKQSTTPTFDNTIVQLEKAGHTFDRVSTIYGIWSSTMSSPDFQLVQREMAPKLAAFSDQITQNEPLFKRIETIYNSPEKKKLNSEQQRLVWLYYTNFVRAGARLDASAKARLTEINQELASLFTKFSNNVLFEEDNQFVTLKSEDDLKGLPQSVRDGEAASAVAKKQPGTWVIMNTRSSVEPFLTYSDRRDLREKVWRMFIMRGDNGGEHDNNAIISQILQLRAERAKLLGYQTHAHWRLENAMAKTPERAMDLMMQVWKPAVARVHEEVADMQALVAKEGSTFEIAPWDYRYYMEKVRKAKYDLDQNEVKPYLQLDKLVEAIHWVAGELFNFKFTPATNVPVAHPDIRVWEVTDKTSGKHIGLWFFDPYARAGKRSGAWMNAYRTQERIDGEITTIVSNNANFVKGKAGEPMLISWDDATTMFHEFGHALHGLNSSVTYPSLSGTSVARDYVEFPSQLMEHWLSTPQVLQKFAVHYQTGKPIPQALVDKINRSKTFNEGFATVEYLSAAILDMKLHLLGSQKIEARAFEKQALDELGMPREIVLRHRLPQFLHVFSSDGYSAGYYSYLWSDVITADAFGAFTEAGGPYDRKVADRLRKNIFSIGNTIDPAEAYRTFRGRDPKVEALMKKRGFSS
jgi:peptidyl-dipeptidase Dcp